MGRVIRPVRVRVMRSEQTDAPAGLCNAMHFGYERHHIRHMFDNMIRDYEVEFIVGKGIRNFTKIVENVGVRAWTYVEPDCALNLINTAADI